MKLIKHMIFVDVDEDKKLSCTATYNPVDI